MISSTSQVLPSVCVRVCNNLSVSLFDFGVLINNQDDSQSISCPVVVWNQRPQVTGHGTEIATPPGITLIVVD